MHLISSLLFMLLFFFIFLVASIFAIVRSLFGFSRKNSGRNGDVRKTAAKPDAGHKRKKFFQPDEGEYIDYEEVDKSDE